MESSRTRLATTAVPAGESVARDSGKTEVLATMLVRYDVGWGDKQGERFTPGPPQGGEFDWVLIKEGDRFKSARLLLLCM